MNEETKIIGIFIKLFNAMVVMLKGMLGNDSEPKPNTEPKPELITVSVHNTADGRGFFSKDLPQLTKPFRAVFTAKPSENKLDVVIGFGLRGATDYKDLACIVRFNQDGFIDVRNGNHYGAQKEIRYKANNAYIFDVHINMNLGVYAVHVTHADFGRVLLDGNAKFREEQKSMLYVDNFTIVSKDGGVTLRDIKLYKSVPFKTIKHSLVFEDNSTDMQKYTYYLEEVGTQVQHMAYLVDGVLHFSIDDNVAFYVRTKDDVNTNSITKYKVNMNAVYEYDKGSRKWLIST